MLAFIIAECGAKVRIIAHRRLISSPFQPHVHDTRTYTFTHTHTHALTYFMFHLAYPCHYPIADVTRAIKPLHCPAARDETDRPSIFNNKIKLCVCVLTVLCANHKTRQELPVDLMCEVYCDVYFMTVEMNLHAVT